MCRNSRGGRFALTGARYHVAHMSARASMRAVRKGKEAGVRVTCEVAPHHFTLTDEALMTPLDLLPRDGDSILVDKAKTCLFVKRSLGSGLLKSSCTHCSTRVKPAFW